MTEEAHDHEDDSADGHDHEVEREPVAPETTAARRATLSAALDAITIDDLNAHLRTAPDQVRQALMKRLAVRLDPKFVKGGVARLIRTRLRGLAPAKQLEMAAELTAGLDYEASQFLGEEGFELPSVEDLDRLVDELLKEHPIVIVRAYFACTAAAEAPVAGELDRLLAEDARLALEPSPA